MIDARRLRRGRLAIPCTLAINLGLLLLLAFLGDEPERDVTRTLGTTKVHRTVEPAPPPDPPPERPDEPPLDEPDPTLPPDLPPLVDAPPAPLDISLDALAPSALPPLAVAAPRMVARTNQQGGSGRGTQEQEAPPRPPERTGPMEASDADRGPVERRGNREPSYPRIAQRRNLQGSVRVRIHIDQTGRVVEYRVIDVQGHSSFQTEVEKVLSDWTFQPAVHQGEPVAVWATKTFDFRGP